MYLAINAVTPRPGLADRYGPMVLDSLHRDLAEAVAAVMSSYHDYLRPSGMGILELTVVRRGEVIGTIRAFEVDGSMPVPLTCDEVLRALRAVGLIACASPTCPTAKEEEDVREPVAV